MVKAAYQHPPIVPIITSVSPGTMDTTISSTMSDDDGSGAMSARSWQAQDAPSPTGSIPSHDDDPPDVKIEGSTADTYSLSGAAAGAAGESSSMLMSAHKRRRVTRACDECRRKKIKCNGNHPCTHCSVYSYPCTYDKPSNRRRNPAPQYIEALENRLQRAETLLRQFMPDVDLADPSLDPTVQQEFQNRERVRAQAIEQQLEEQRLEEQQQQQQQKPKQDEIPSQQKAPGYQEEAASADGEEIMSMIETIGQLDLTEGGEWDFHGISSGAVFLRKMKENFHGLLGRDSLVPYLKRPPRPPGLFTLDSPRSAGSSPWDASNHPYYTLPPKEHARTLCYFSLNCATCLLRIIHLPSFFEMFDRLYEQAPENLGPDDHRQLGLLYSVLALGCMYNISEESESNPINYKAAMNEGFKYYTTARILLQDITDCRDLTSLQALVYIILFLQATSNLSGCYSFIGIALRTALRMGLHRNLPHAKLTAIESESRRRVFYVIRQMDTYVSAILGFPMALRDDDVDQPMPTEVDDEYITKDGIVAPPPSTPSFFEACNAYSRLMKILTKVIRCIYPVKGLEQCIGSHEGIKSTYTISYSKIKLIERDLQEWFEELPAYWRPSSDGPIEVVRVRTLLRFAYAHVQMMMYRPFLHYVSPRMSAGQSVDERYYACAAAAVSVSRNIVHIGLEIRKQAVLIGPYWFILYTEFFAILSLVYYALENSDKPGTSEVMSDAVSGKAVIASLSKRSMAADRVTAALNALFEQLPDQLKKGKARSAAPMRKRSARAPKGSPVTLPSTSTGPKGRRSTDISHTTGLDPLRQIPRHRVSLDTTQQQQQQAVQQPEQMPVQQLQQPHGITATAFPGSFLDFLPLDIPSGTGSPDSGGTPSTGQRSAAGFATHHTSNASLNGLGMGHGASGSVAVASADGSLSSTLNPLYKLDAMMFPSGDPFAYPSQPAMDFGLQEFMGVNSGSTVGSDGGGNIGNGSVERHLTSRASKSSISLDPQQQPQQQQPDTTNFYAGGLYGEIEGQLLGPVPAYLMQTSDAPTGLDLASEMYNASSLLTLQQTQMHNAQQQQQQQQPADVQHHHHQQHMEEVFASSNFDIFSGQYQQPM